MGFLDHAGLAYFWGKVRTALAGKQDVITAGDGLEKTGDTLGVTTPVRGVITQEAFDALPEEERNKGVYVIPGGGSGGSGGSAEEVYSTEERRIGTWIDGKPLYRITFYRDYNATGSGVFNASFGIENCEFDEVPNINGTLYFLNGIDWPLNFTQDTSHFSAFVNGSSHIYCTSNARFSEIKRVTITIEYTKTTDEGGTA